MAKANTELGAEVLEEGREHLMCRVLLFQIQTPLSEVLFSLMIQTLTGFPGFRPSSAF